MKKRYNDLNSYFKGLYGARVHKISVDAGLTCPNRDGTISWNGCIYCNEKGSGTGAHNRGLSIRSQLEGSKKAIIKRFKAKYFIAYFQSFTNTYAPLKTLKQLYDQALAVEDIVGLSIGTRPDCVNEQILTLLSDYAKQYLIWLEYGLQSIHDITLKKINRGHDFACFKKAVENTRNRGINICAHVILGLPGENRAMMMETAEMLGDLGIDGVKLHLQYVVKGTALEKFYRNNQYSCLNQIEYANLVCDFLERLPSSMIIHRLTGDPHPAELVAPDWALNKPEIFALIKQTLENRDSWQAKYKKES